MKRSFLPVALLSAVLLVTLVLANQSSVQATPVDSSRSTLADLPLVPPVALEMKRCSTSSDCPNSKCSGGQCGACSTSSDCRYGKCSGGRCGACSTSSDCGGWGKCSSGRCGSCSTSSDCGSFGSCSGGRCAKTPY